MCIHLYSILGCGGASIANGEIRFPSGTDYNAIAFVNCSTGFHYDLTMENNQIVCLHSGVWNISVQCKINGNCVDWLNLVDEYLIRSLCSLYDVFCLQSCCLFVCLVFIFGHLICLH